MKSVRFMHRFSTPAMFSARTDLVRTTPVQTALVRTALVRTALVRTALVRTALVQTALVRAGSSRNVPVRTTPVRNALVRAGSSRNVPVRTLVTCVSHNMNCRCSVTHYDCHNIIMRDCRCCCAYEIKNNDNNSYHDLCERVEKDNNCLLLICENARLNDEANEKMIESQKDIQ